MNKADRIYVAGHGGLVGAAVTRELERQGYLNTVVRTREELDLTRSDDVLSFMMSEKPDIVIAAAAKVGGVLANDTYPADFIRENLQIQSNLIDSAYRAGVKRFVFLGSSCVYPKFADQPIQESALLSGPLEATNRAYAVAKIAGIEMCQAYRSQYGFDAISLMPTNLYGPRDNFDLETSHVLPALIRKFDEAKVSGSRTVTIWGTGKPRREFLYVDDLASAVVFLAQHYQSGEIINVGTGEDLSIAEVAALVAEVVGFAGGLVFDSSKPDGTPRKVLDVGRVRSLGWSPSWSLRDGIAETYRWYKTTT